MADAIDQAIALLEAEQSQISDALAALRRVRQNRNGGHPETAATDRATPGGDGADLPLSDDNTNEQAVDTVLARTGGGLKTSEIVEKSAELGKELNKNSVRWTLSHGVDDGKYVRKKDGRANRYWLASDR